MNQSFPGSSFSPTIGTAAANYTTFGYYQPSSTNVLWQDTTSNATYASAGSLI